MSNHDHAAPLPEEKVAELAERTCSAICEGDAPMGIPDAENPRHRIAACYEHHRTAQALAPLVAGWLAEGEQDRDHWKAHAEEAGAGFARVCRDYAAASARAVRLRNRVEAVCDEAEKHADTYKRACIVTTGQVRAALAEPYRGDA